MKAMFHLTHLAPVPESSLDRPAYFARAGFFFGAGAGLPGAIRFKVRSNASGDSSDSNSRAIFLKSPCCALGSNAFFFAFIAGV
jgi:hypothetical protein